MSRHPRYTLSQPAFSYLLTLKLPPKRDRTRQYHYVEWDGQSDLTYEALAVSRHTQRPVSNIDHASHGISRSLDVLALTTPLDMWTDNRPDFLRAQHNLYPLTPPPELTTFSNTSRKPALAYLQYHQPPTYTLPYYDIALTPQDRDRYELNLLELTRDYLYTLAIQFKMRPFHRGGRNTRTALISVALEAIGLQYIIRSHDDSD